MYSQADLVDLDLFLSVADPHLTAFPRRTSRVTHFKLHAPSLYLIGPGLAFRRYRLRAPESPLSDAAQTTAQDRADSVGLRREIDEIHERRAQAREELSALIGYMHPVSNVLKIGRSYPGRQAGRQFQKRPRYKTGIYTATYSHDPIRAGPLPSSARLQDAPGERFQARERRPGNVCLRRHRCAPQAVPGGGSR